MIKNIISVFTQGTLYSCQILMKHEFSRQFFEKKKYSNTKFHEYPSSGSQVVPCGLAGGHDIANSSFSQFCQRP